MKFKGFSNPVLNLGPLDVKLTTGDGPLRSHSCSECGFATPEMMCCDCGHVYCGGCLLTFKEDTLNAPVPKAMCVPCQRDTSCMRVNISEEFVAQLQALCPHCNITVLVEELKAHYECCLSSGVNSGGVAIPTSTVVGGQNP